MGTRQQNQQDLGIVSSTRMSPPAGGVRIHQCPVCETVVEVLAPCGIELVCCGRPMIPVRARQNGPGRDEHAPVVHAVAGGLKVRAGDADHPCEKDHYIQWIEIVAAGKCYRQFLKPGQPAEAFFETTARRVTARAYCSRHGLWATHGFPRPARSSRRRATSSLAVDCV